MKTDNRGMLVGILILVGFVLGMVLLAYGSQNSTLIVNGTGAAVITNSNSYVNNALDTLQTNFSGPSAPGSPKEKQWWYDTTNNILKQYLNGSWVAQGNGPAISKTSGYSFVSGDMNQIFDFNVSSSTTATLVSASTVSTGSWLRLKSSGTATVILSGTVEGVSNQPIPAGAEALIFTDGSSWRGSVYATLDNNGMLKQPATQAVSPTITGSVANQSAVWDARPLVSIVTKTTGYTFTSTDCGKTFLFNLTSSATVTLISATTVTSCEIISRVTGSAINLSGAVMLGLTSLSSTTIAGGYEITLVSDGTTWYGKESTSSVYRLSNSNPWIGTPTTSRARNTVYQNLTGKPIYVNIIMTSSSGDDFYLEVGPTSTPSMVVSRCFIQNWHCTLSGIVLPGYYYEETGSTNNNPAISIWTEWN